MARLSVISRLTTSKRQLQRHLGMMNFYRQFLPNRDDTILPFKSLLSVHVRSFRFSADAYAAFDKVKATLTDATLLTHSSLNLHIALMVSASIVAFGAALQEHLAGSIHNRMTAYHLAASKVVERFHRHLETPLCAADDPKYWMDHLSLILFGIHSPLKSDLVCLAVELVCGVTLRLPGKMVLPTPGSEIEDRLDDNYDGHVWRPCLGPRCVKVIHLRSERFRTC
nr:unnamed protein product [Spirometra erinaceieuropaei]